MIWVCDAWVCGGRLSREIGDIVEWTISGEYCSVGVSRCVPVVVVVVVRLSYIGSLACLELLGICGEW